MAPFHDPVRRVAHENVGQVMSAEALPRTRRGGQHLHGRNGHVLPHRLPGAHVAAAASPGVVLAEVREKRDAPADLCADITEDLAQACLGPRAFLGAFDLPDLPADGGDIGRTVEEHRIRVVTVARGTAGFLVVALHAPRKVRVHDPSHVGLVDAHPERDRRHHHDGLVPDERLLPAAPVLVIDARVIRHGPDPVSRQVQRGLSPRPSVCCDTRSRAAPRDCG